MTAGNPQVGHRSHGPNGRSVTLAESERIVKISICIQGIRSEQ